MNKLTTLFTVILVLVVTGCKTTIPMPTYSNKPVVNYNNSERTIEDVEKYIMKAALSLGWKTEKKSPGKIQATLIIRKHILTVMITHDTEYLSVDYVDSTNLKYTGSKIHRQYANWINNLLRQINVYSLND